MKTIIKPTQADDFHTKLMGFIYFRHTLYESNISMKTIIKPTQADDFHTKLMGFIYFRHTII